MVNKIYFSEDFIPNFNGEGTPALSIEEVEEYTAASSETIEGIFEVEDGKAYHYVNMIDIEEDELEAFVGYVEIKVA